MRIIYNTLFLGLFLLFFACKEETKSASQKKEVQTKEVAAQTGMVPNSWVVNRVAKAKLRLANSEAGKLVWQAMEAHGGLYKWYSNGALSFRFNYQPLNGKTVRDSYQVVDVYSNRARHTSIADSADQFGWNGKTAWVVAKNETSFEYDTKFWALTPIYFLGQPFVLDGQGVNLELLPQKVYKGKNNDVVKVTFDAGTGDAPDDYYILYFDVDTHLLQVIRYIVSYPEYFKDGGHAPEKFMEVSELKTINGITFPTHYKTYWLGKDEMPAEHITKIEVSDIKYVENITANYFDAPEGAKILN